MHRHPLLTLLASLSLASACTAAPEPSPPTAIQDAGMLSDLAERIEARLAQIRADPCAQSGLDHPNCAWGDFAYDPGQFSMNHSTGEAILLVDDFPQLPIRAIRYKNRLKGFFRVDTSGAIAPAPFTWHVPRVLHDTLSEFASADFLPAEVLRPLALPLEDAYGDLAYQSSGHGSYVFSALIESNPLQPVVVLDSLSYPRFAPDEFCDRSDTNEAHTRLRNKSQQVANNLRQLMAAHNVRFVNVSSGETLATMRGRWTENCGGSVPGDNLLRKKLEAYTPIVDALYNTPGVFAAQAAIDASNTRDNPFDFPDTRYPNRLLVGYITTRESGLDETGGGDTSSLGGWPARQNVDVYLNSGVLPNRPFLYNTTPLLQVDSFGVDIFPITRTTTSWITPLALSRFIHVRYGDERFSAQPMSNALIQGILDVVVPTGCDNQPGGRCAYQDPLKHGQLEAVRLEYRGREYQEPLSSQSMSSRRMEHSQ